MPIKHASIKDLRKAKKRTTRNLGVKRQMEYLVKQLEQLVTDKNVAELKAALVATIQKIDKAAKVKVIHKNTAARMKSRLTRKVNTASK